MIKFSYEQPKIKKYGTMEELTHSSSGSGSGSGSGNSTKDKSLNDTTSGTNPQDILLDTHNGHNVKRD